MDYTILVIDDNKMLHILIRKILGEEYNLLHARDAQEGINIISEKKINLILSDIHMPGMSGLDFLESLAKDAERHDIPVLIITSDPSPEKESKAHDLGAADFIDKQLLHKDPQKLRERIQMKLVTNIREPDLAKDLQVDKKKIAKILMSEAISGDFFTASRKLLMEIRTEFDIDYISFWTITGKEPHLIITIGEVQPKQFGAEELQWEVTFQQMLEKPEAYLSNNVFSGEKGIMVEDSREFGFPSEIGIPLFDVDEKTLLKHKFEMPKNASLFGYIVLKRGKLFPEKEYNLIRRLLMQSGTILWRLYNNM